MINRLAKNKQRQSLAARATPLLWPALAACLWLVSTTSQASQWQPHRDIYQAVNQFSQQHLGGHATTTKLDERSRYPLCKSSLQVTLPFNNHKTVKVLCEDTYSNTKPSWSLFLSLEVQTNTKAWRLVDVIAEQATIQAHQVALTTYNGTGHDFIGSETNPVGKQVIRRLSVGHWLELKDFSELQLLWRASVDIPQGQDIASEHLIPSKEAIRTASPNVITNKDQILGQLAKRYIKAGKLIDKNDVEGQKYLVVSRHALAMGRAIIAADLKMRWVPEHKLRVPGFSHAETLIGWVTKRNIPSGTPITQDMLRQAYLVSKGSQVSLQINLDNYQVTSLALALSNGNLGDKIDLKVMPSGLIKSGVVIAKGQVELSR